MLPWQERFPASRVIRPTSQYRSNPRAQSPYYLVAELYFESMQAMQAGFASAEGQAASADIQNFATGGVTLLAGEVHVYDTVSIS